MAAASSKPRLPPNLKGAQACGDCKYFNGNGLCEMYDWPVDDDEHCDSWVAVDVKDATKRAWAAHRRRIAKGA
jgi:hypothetical protein